MRRILLSLGLCCLFAMTNNIARSEGQPTKLSNPANSVPVGYLTAFEQKLREATQNQSPVIEGGLARGRKASDPPVKWLFFTPELRAVLSPPFWGDKAAAVSRSSNPKYSDPLEPILNFHTQLKDAGIELWIVPVPAKAAVYAQLISDEFVMPPFTRHQADRTHGEFYHLLNGKGVTVVDLQHEYRRIKEEQEPSYYCATDSHWSGSGVQRAAATLAKQIKKLAWYQPLPKTQFHTEPYEVEITGDLAKLLNEKDPVKETLTLTRVSQIVDGKSVPVTDDPNSPIVLLGDSHTLIFHDPRMFATGSGLADHLAEQTGIPLDVIGVRGSGANAARLNWRRRADPLVGKKLVIWCFSMREFTENTDGWRVIPIKKP